MSDRELIDAAALRLGTSQAGLARHIGVSTRTANLWATGKTRIPRPARMLLECIVAGHARVITATITRTYAAGADVEAG